MGTTAFTRRRTATAVGVALLLACGWGYRAAEDRLADVSGTVPLPRGTLAAVPLEIAGWIGRDVPLDEHVVRATATDDHINRVYRRGRDVVTLFVGYGVQLRDLAPHRPQVCYPGAGWTLSRASVEHADANDGVTLPFQIHRFYRAGLAQERITVLNYYLVDGVYCPDVSLLRSKAWRLKNDVRYAAQVQITCTPRFSHAWDEEVASRFAADAAPVIRAVLTDAVTRVADATLRNAESHTP